MSTRPNSAFGTALPESVVTLVAVAFKGGPAQKDIGVGAALGGPLVLATIAYAVAGWTLLAPLLSVQLFDMMSHVSHS